MIETNRGYELVDVCHTVEDGMITYKGLPPPVITDHLTREQSRSYYAPGTEFQIGKIEMVANTGTYLDSPLTIPRISAGRPTQFYCSTVFQSSSIFAVWGNCPRRGSGFSLCR